MAFRDRYDEAQIPHFDAWHQRRMRIKSESHGLITPTTRIATIGSCFAEELAAAMDRFGLEGGMNPTGLVYNTRSLRQEILGAFGEWNGFRPEPAWKIQSGFISPFHHPKEVRASEEDLAAWMTELRSRATKLFRTADVIVITLGLVECWVDRDTGVAYRYLPHEDVFDSVAPRFHRLTVAEMIDDLDTIRKSIRRNTGAEIVVTVSPVPLHATFTPLDIRVANAESKARIRAAASEFTEAHPDVHYFHSYEIVTTAERQSDFMLEDGRHVSRRGVDFILAEFLGTFGGQGVSIPAPDTSWITRPTQTARSGHSGFFAKVRTWANRALR